MGFIFDYEPTSEQFGWLIQNLLQNAEEATAVMQLRLIIKYKSKHEAEPLKTNHTVVPAGLKDHS